MSSPAPAMSITPSPTWSISTENGNKYNNQLHYYAEHGWPPGWGDTTSEQNSQSAVQEFDDSAIDSSSVVHTSAITRAPIGIAINDQGVQTRYYEDKGVQSDIKLPTPSPMAMCSCGLNTSSTTGNAKFARESGTAELRRPRKGKRKQAGVADSESDESGEDKENVLSMGNRKRKAKGTGTLGVTGKRQKVLEGES